ncbi:MAG: hypothetical protein Q7T82_11015 [Armatimonadota bacterium]|nr:hypothetical protein [Armatimonadota bacterium]
MRKYLIIAISVLAIALLAGPSVWALNSSVVVSDTIPATMTMGTTYTPTVKMRNSGDTTWADVAGCTFPSGPFDYNFGPPDVGDPWNKAAEWGPRTNIGAIPVGPGEEITFTLSIMPNAPGTFPCRWRMVHECLEWFGAELARTITVECGPPAADTVKWADNFDTYTPNGMLNGALTPPDNPEVDNDGDPGWILRDGSQNSSQINIVDDAIAGKNVEVVNIFGNTLDSRVQVASWSPSWNTGDNGNRAKFHFKVKSGGTAVGTTLWRLYMRDWIDGGRPYFAITGTDQSLTPMTAINSDGQAPTLTAQDISDGAWHTVDIIMNTSNDGAPDDLSYYYFDGNYIGVLAHDGGLNQQNKVRTVEIWQYAQSGQPTSSVLLDDMVVSTALGLPVNTITSPTPGYVFGTLTPTITWTRAWSCYDVAATQVIVVSGTADPVTGTLEWDSGDVSGANLSQVTGSLPNATPLWVFQRDKLTGGGYNPWTDARAFSCSVTPPVIGDVTGPVGIQCTGKPVVTFTGDPHSLVQIRLTSDAGGVNEVANTGEVASFAFAQAVGPLDSGTYYAWARIGGGAGWSAYSANVFSFVVDRGCEVVDIRHFNETDILTTNLPAPDDGFAERFTNFDDGAGTSCDVWITTPVCGDQAMWVNDRGAARSLRPHRIQNIDLDQGVTLLVAVANPIHAGNDGGGASWRMANVWIGDKDAGGETHMVSVRVQDDFVGIITEATKATEAWGNGFTNVVLPNSTDYRILRITGRNAVAGDYDSAVWNIYVNENPTAVLTRTGTFSVGQVESEPPYQLEYRECDQIALGQGSGDSTGDPKPPPPTGDWYYDWVAVNGGGDYAPGQWPSGASGSYASIGAAKSVGVESIPVSITGNAVITKVLTHVDPGPDAIPGTPDDVTVQDGYYAQDVAAGGKNLAGVKILTSDAQGGAVAVGAQITAVSGVMREQAGGRVIANASVTLGGIATFAPVAMAQKALYGPCITQNLGSSSDTTSMMVRFFGKCMLSGFDPNWGTCGAYVFYIDDGSGAADGRELIDGLPVPGIRCLQDACDPLFIPPSPGDYLMVEGIVSYEHAMTADIPPVDLGNVRTILFPSYTTLYIPPPP